MGKVLSLGRRPTMPMPGQVQKPEVSKELLEFQKQNLDPEKMLKTILYQEQRMAILESQVTKLKHQSTLNMIFAQAAVEALITKGVIKEQEIKEASTKLKEQADKKAQGIVKDVPTRKVPPVKAKKSKKKPNDRSDQVTDQVPGPQISSAADVEQAAKKATAARRAKESNDAASPGRPAGGPKESGEKPPAAGPSPKKT
jgi:hypothetical protein